jgi:hypothetical protein
MKKKHKSTVFAQTVAPNAPIPDAVALTRSKPLFSSIVVGKKFKGKVVGDVNVTGFQTTGSAAASAAQLTASLTAPNGRTIDLFADVGGQSLGPWTIDDDTVTSICNAPPPAVCSDSTETLGRPFAGTSNTVYNNIGQYPTNGPLATFNGVPMKGTWTVTIADLNASGPATSILNQWGLQIVPKKAPK